MSFELRNKIMVLVADDLTAYGIAQKFIMDDEQKFTVFERCFNQSRQHGTMEAIASVAKDKAVEIWETMTPEVTA